MLFHLTNMLGSVRTIQNNFEWSKSPNQMLYTDYIPNSVWMAKNITYPKSASIWTNWHAR
jgi:hypothetical protein